MRKYLGPMFVVAALSAAACGGKDTAPTAPTTGSTVPVSPAGPSTSSAATITGSIEHAAPTATVGVAGTAMQTGVDAGGRFALANVPAGDVQLQVSSAGASVMVPLANVRPAQTVEVVVNLSGSSAQVESEIRHGAGEAEIKGTVEALTGAATFTMAGKSVTTNSSTVFTNGPTNTFADLKVGSRVEVKGSLSGAAVTATRVEIEDAADHAPAPVPGPQPNPPAPGPGPNPGPAPNPAPVPREAEFTGTISGLTGTASAFQFSVGSRLVKGDAATSILGHSNTAVAFADLKNGALVEVKGTDQTTFVQSSRIKLENDDEVEEVKVEGTLGTVSGACPAIASTVTTTKFTTSASTRFDDPCAGFKSGDRVEVRGTMLSGSLAATRLRKR